MDNYSAVAPPHANNPVDTQTAFADAVARARQIAEKLQQPSGNQQPPQSQPPVELLGPQGLKRPYDDPLETGHHQEGSLSQRGPMEPRRAYGGGPDAKKLAAINDPIGAQIRAMQEQQRSYQSQAAQQLAHDKAQQLNQKIHAMPAQRPPLLPEQQAGSSHTDEMTIPNRMVGLIIGKNGETITKLQADSGCKVQIAQEECGHERPCTLSGEPHQILKAKQLIQEIVETGRSAGATVGENETQIEMMIPGTKVGLIIGKSGETIKQLQANHLVRMVMIQDSKDQTNVPKPLRITGEKTRCLKAQQAVSELLEQKESEIPDMGRRNDDMEGHMSSKSGGIHRIPDVFQSMQSGMFGGGNGNDYGGRGDGGKAHKKDVIKIPKGVVGHVIGRGGETIKEIQAATGTRVQFQKDDQDDHTCHERACHISGSPESVKAAIEKIYDTIRDSENRRGGGRDNHGGGGGMGHFHDGNRRGGSGNGCDEEEHHFHVPGEKCGLVIGKGGENIRNIISACGAHVELQKNCPPGAHTKAFVIRGQSHQIQKAILEICRKANIDPPPMPSGGPPGGPGGPSMDGSPGMGGPGGPGGPPGGYENMGNHGHGHGQQQQQQQPPHPSSYNQPQGWQNAYGGGGGGSGGGGGGGSNWGQPQQQQPPQQPPQQQQQQPPSSGSMPVVEPSFNPVTGQRDYSAAWAEYYKVQGWGPYIDQILQQAQTGGCPSGPMGGAPSAGAPQQPNPQSAGAMQGQPGNPPQQSAPSQYGQQQQYTSYPGYNSQQQSQGQYGGHGGQQYGQYGQYGQ
ncbi:far upstream element-binding protein 1-like isoform X2 [Lineus longissimus]|uniref:far upstream element-binding protein 1-like isoform X2 n=1 Tax=Lineus longissimus TaxID=88925 RepID=UPI00315C600F